jgi:hypothetical protein
MSVSGFGPLGESPSPDERDRADDHTRVLLVERARTARTAAQEVRGRARELRWLLHEWKRGSPVSRCASCGRHRVGDRWLRPDVVPAAPAGPVAETICDECSENPIRHRP